MANGGTVTFNFKGDDKDLDKKTKVIDEKLKSLGKSVGSVFLKGASVAGAAMTALVGVSIKSYADMEQNLGGVETLFKNSADTVIANAKKAYETAGLSANQYMETVTSFSASLLQSLGGDTVKAAEVADMAIIDMSDNANKMGTSMELIQNAYQGFAKQNYTMLDNLKLGYGGTKEEMQRLLADAEKITGIKYDISNLNDVYQAIHIIQGELGITGTTAKEATETISGSVNAVKGAWSNFMSGSGSVDEVISTVSIAITNVGKALTTMSPKIVDGLVGLVNGLLPEIPKLIQGLLPTVLNGVIGLVTGIINVFPQVVSMLASLLPQITQSLITGLIQIMNSLSAMLPTLIPQIVEAVLGLIPTLLNNLPMFIDAGIQLIIGLANGLINAIPVIIDMLPQIIESLINGLMGALPQIMTLGPTLLIGLASSLIKALPALANAIPQIINSIVNGLLNGISSFMNTGTAIIINLVDGILNTIPTLVSTIPQIIGSLLNGLVGGLFKFGTVGLKIVMELVTGIVTNIPHLLALVPKILGGLLDGILSGLGSFASAGIQIIGNMWNGMSSAIIKVLSLIPGFPKNILEQIRNGLSSIGNIGKNLVQGLWNGIADVTGWIVNKIKGFGKTVLSAIKGIFGIHSPSTEFAWIGKMNILGLEKGMEDMKGDLNTTFDDMMNLSPTLLANASNTYSPNVNVVVNNSFEQDPLGQMVQSQKTFSSGSKNDYNFGMGV